MYAYTCMRACMHIDISTTGGGWSKLSLVVVPAFAKPRNETHKGWEQIQMRLFGRLCIYIFLLLGLVEEKSVGVQIYFVLGTRYNGGNLPCSFQLPQLDECWVLSYCVADHLCGLRLSFCSNDDRSFILQCLEGWRGMLFEHQIKNAMRTNFDQK